MRKPQGRGEGEKEEKMCLNSNRVSL